MLLSDRQILEALFLFGLAMSVLVGCYTFLLCSAPVCFVGVSSDSLIRWPYQLSHQFLMIFDHSTVLVVLYSF